MVPTLSTTEIVLLAVAVLALAGLITFLVLFVVSRRQLTEARRELETVQRERQGRRRRLGVAPLAIKTVFQTADMLINKGFGAAVRNSIEDLAGWAQVERPDLARLTADGNVVLVFSDIEGSTEANETMGDRAWVKLLGRHNQLIQKRVDAHGGHVVKTQGDGFMIAFADAKEAVRCSAEIQQALSEDPDRWNAIRVRIGIHLGTSVRRGDDLFGLDVAMAARVADQADGGEILISKPVRDALGEMAGIRVGDSRDAELKGLRGVHTLYLVESA